MSDVNQVDEEKGEWRERKGVEGVEKAWTGKRDTQSAGPGRFRSGLVCQLDCTRSEGVARRDA